MREELWKLFERGGKVYAVEAFSQRNGFSKEFTLTELDRMIDDAYSMAFGDWK